MQVQYADMGTEPDLPDLPAADVTAASLEAAAPEQVVVVAAEGIDPDALPPSAAMVAAIQAAQGATQTFYCSLRKHTCLSCLAVQPACRCMLLAVVLGLVM